MISQNLFLMQQHCHDFVISQNKVYDNRKINFDITQSICDVTNRSQIRYCVTTKSNLYHVECVILQNGDYIYVLK